MRRPNWVTIVGVLGIVFACMGILYAGQEIFLPKMIDLQSAMFQDFDSGKTGGETEPPEIFKWIKKLYEVPEWYQDWAIPLGILNALISSFFLFASIWILLLKPSSIRIFYWSAGLTIVYMLIKLAIMIRLYEYFFVTILIGSNFSGLVSIVLIIVVASGDKRAFQVSMRKQRMS